ncbi:MAG: glycosyltransferase [Anaerolineales bacterium]|jgi:1,2-diacylglycerol 3-beta-galactosyltransferase|nr:glycosyltransferase [Anaerolineales bacterium]
MKKILILMADYGYGHRSAANAIAEALHETHGQECQVDIVNPLNDPRAPAFFRENQHDYDKMVREMPELYKLGYQVGETPLVSSLVKGTFTLTLFNVLREIIRQKQPDVIVCPYPFYQGILSAVFASEKQHIPLLTVVTDLATVNRLWFQPATDLCLVPTQTVYDLAIKAGLPPEKVKITGVPVRPELVKGNKDLASLRLSLGWHPDLFTVLAVGSKRVEHLYDSLKVLNHSGLPVQLVVVAGGADELYRRFQETEWHVETQYYNFVAGMGSFMRAADCILSKAGGLIVSEALACGLPMILVDVIPGQETGNAEYVVSGNAGVLARDPIEVLETMCHWLEKDRRLYLHQAQNARKLGHPRAAYEVADLAWAAASS